MTLIRKMSFLLPLVIFLLIVFLLWRGLSLRPSYVPSPLVSKPAPQFELPLLYNPNQFTSNAQFLGHITLLTVWASWCYMCMQENEFLLELAKKSNLTLYGFNYKDDPEMAQIWLKQLGNPFSVIGVDRLGKTAIDWGVYGVPETFLIDKKGMIRYKHVGPLTPESYQKNLEPLIEQLQAESV